MTSMQKNIMKNLKILSVLFVLISVLVLSGCDFAETELGENEVEVLKSKSSFTNVDYETVVNTIQEWGFTNIELVPVYDIVWDFTDSGTIKSVTIDGSDEFRNGDIFEKDVLVIITYSMPDHEDPTKLKYDISWQNADESVIKIDEVLWGEIPVYSGETPTKDSLNEIRYVFNGWTPELTEVTGNQIYVALFVEEENDFTITWKNDDGSVLEVDNNVKYGVIPTYDGNIPIKDGDDEYTYVFDKWSPEISAADKEQEYIPLFTAVLRTFTLETAKKVVIVGMTNYMALDVFDDTGTYIDRSKFHPYSYSGVYSLSISSPGTWTSIDEDTWYVSGLELYMDLYSSTYVFYGNVTYNGEYYMISEADNGKSSNPSQYISKRQIVDGFQ